MYLIEINTIASVMLGIIFPIILLSTLWVHSFFYNQHLITALLLIKKYLVALCSSKEGQSIVSGQRPWFYEVCKII
jgi:hypothetical protein